MQQFTEILQAATAGIDEQYFLLPIHGGESVYRERVYCYELYHQLRLRWPNDTKWTLNGEVDKQAHPYFEGDGAPKPDLLVHVPGTGDNYAVFEVKASRPKADGIRKDLETLLTFTARFGYRRGIYLIYGADEPDATIAAVQRVAEAFRDIPPVELWLHAAPGQPAEPIAELLGERP